MTYKITFLIAAFLFSGFASADWTDPGVAYKCDQRSGTFSLVATMATSTPDIGTVDVPDGYQAVTESSTVNCSLDGAQIKADIVILEARAQGMCGAVGGAGITRLSINSHSVLENQAFNYYCQNPESYYKIEVFATQHDLRITGCHASWDWGVGYTETHCDESP